LDAAQDNWNAELRGQLDAAKRSLEAGFEDRLARAQAEWGAAGSNRPEPQYGANSGRVVEQGSNAPAPDAEAVARGAIEEVKREAEEAKRSLDERRHQAKLETRRVTDKRHRKTTLGMKEKAATYEAKRSSSKVILAIAALVMIGFAAFIFTTP